MPVTYTNRKGRTYYLCQGVTKTGKVRYYFALQPKEDSPDQIPEGYRISESVNGVVSLVRDRPQVILPREIASVEAALGRHPKHRDYRVAVQNNRIVIYERLGPDAVTLTDLFGGISLLPPEVLKNRIQEQLDRSGRFSPVMRFTLLDPDKRKFKAERWNYLGSVDDWINVRRPGKLESMARQLIPTLGNDDFFNLY